MPSELYSAGAFPEVRQAQFPLGMGKGDGKGQGTVALTLSSDGTVNYDAILKQSKLSDKNVTSSHNALVPKLDDINKGVRCSFLQLRNAVCAGSAAINGGFFRTI